MNSHAIMAAGPVISDEERHAHLSLLPDRYFLQSDPAEVQLHLEMVHRLLHTIAAADSVGTLRPVIEWRPGPREGTAAVHIVTWDRAGLFGKLAGAFGAAGLSIQSARIATRTDHLVLDTFVVGEQSAGLTSAREYCNRVLEDALTGRREFTPPAPRSAGDIPPLVEIYRETAGRKLIVEVHAADRLGLLHQLASVLARHGLDVSFARIGTERGLVLDTFHVAPADHRPVPDDDGLRQLRQDLLAAAR